MRLPSRRFSFNVRGGRVEAAGMDHQDEMQFFA